MRRFYRQIERISESVQKIGVVLSTLILAVGVLSNLGLLGTFSLNPIPLVAAGVCLLIVLTLLRLAFVLTTFIVKGDTLYILLTSSIFMIIVMGVLFEVMTHRH